MKSNVTLPRAEQEKLGKIRTFSGLYVDPLYLRPQDVRIIDIAHHLSLLCRYTGACPFHYSVGHHSIMVAAKMGILYPGEKEGQLAGLLHDAAEAYLNDIASPVKHALPLAEYRRIEHATGIMIMETFGLDPEWMAKTKPADDLLFSREVDCWWGDNRDPILEKQPRVVEHYYLRLFEQLR